MNDSVSDTDEFFIRSHQTAQSAHCAMSQINQDPSIRRKGGPKSKKLLIWSSSAGRAMHTVCTVHRQHQHSLYCTGSTSTGCKLCRSSADPGSLPKIRPQLVPEIFSLSNLSRKYFLFQTCPKLVPKIFPPKKLFSKLSLPELRIAILPILSCNC